MAAGNICLEPSSPPLWPSSPQSISRSSPLPSQSSCHLGLGEGVRGGSGSTPTWVKLCQELCLQPSRCLARSSLTKKSYNPSHPKGTCFSSGPLLRHHLEHLHHYLCCLAGKVAFSPNLPALEAAEILNICNFQRSHFSVGTISLEETATWQVVEGGGKLS